MVFLNTIGVPSPVVSAYCAGTTQAICHQTQAKQETNSGAELTNKKVYSKGFFSTSTPLTVLKTALATIILSFAIYKSPAVILSLNEMQKFFNRAASPTKQQNNITSKEEPKEELKPFLWGNEGLNHKNISQYKPKCQIIANIIASTFTEEGVKKLESLIEVTDYNLDKNNFYINFKVYINGKSIPVLYRDLVQNDRLFFKTNPGAPHAIAYAIEKELAESYLPNPSGLTSLSTATFLTEKIYSTLRLSDISDSSLIAILQQAPSEIITLGSYSSSSINFSENFLRDKSKLESRHEYAVKSYKYENGQHLIKIYSANNEITLTLDELKENIETITAPTNTFKLVDEKTLGVYFLSLIALIALRKAISRLENKKQASIATT